MLEQASIKNGVLIKVDVYGGVFMSFLGLPIPKDTLKLFKVTRHSKLNHSYPLKSIPNPY